jgi:hypothetical protein
MLFQKHVVRTKFDIYLFILINIFIYYSEKKVQTVMVSNCTDINKTNNLILIQIIERYRRPRPMAWEIQVLSSDSHKNATVFSRSIHDPFLW